MKKKTILMAVFAVMAAASAAGAEDIKVDFDGKKSVSAVPAEDIKADFDGKKSASVFLQLVSQAHGAVPEAAADITPVRVKAEDLFNLRMMSILDVSIRSAIDYSETQNDKVLKSALEEFLVKATPQQKYEFVYGVSRGYHLPSFDSNKGVAQWVCTAVTKTVCKAVCDPGCVQDCQDIIVDSCKWM